ncbi:hypothetical protein [Kitasatospora sp. LaBMicrA B282]|uniref:hypothetical protein n=1 Tax=Kitasatospora sp. LaBMicrA B282 TaxID=3420949 RepID=UPI003D0B98C8
MSWDMVLVSESDLGDSEYHFNATSMEPVKNAMAALRMTVPVAEPRWPRATDFGLRALDIAHLDESDPDLPQAVREFFAADSRVREWSPESPAGIPSYKIGGTNDNWLVTPEEVRRALAAYDSADQLAREEAVGGVPGWEGWISFLRTAAEHGGFRVE